MSSGRENEIKLPSLDELFSSQQERDEAKLKHIYEIPIDQIDPFPDHPFKVRDDEDMMNLVESVKVNGVLTPATVRKKDGGRYELLSGHRRMRACQIAGLETLRCEVVDMSRDEAVQGTDITELSMGMSQDYDLAARCGATMVRIGSALFR